MLRLPVSKTMALLNTIELYYPHNCAKKSKESHTIFCPDMANNNHNKGGMCVIDWYLEF